MFVAAFAPMVAAGNAMDGKDPAYFVDRYGPAKSSRTESEAGFLHLGSGFIGVKGQFSERIYRKGDLTVHATFFLPSLLLAAVRFDLPHQWTPEQIEVALNAYGGDWQADAPHYGLTTWTAPDGSYAISASIALEIQSKTVVKLVEETLAEREARKKTIPKF